MPIIKYIGKTTDFSGKPLWEILGNLKNFGVGRLVTRNMTKRYPEPCFYRILQAEPLRQKKDEDRRMRVVVEKVFRGLRYPNAIEMETQTYKADFRLIPKHEEANLWKAVEETKIVEKILPNSIEFPPLLKYMIMEESKAKGQPVTEPKLKLKIKTAEVQTYRLAEEGETPNVGYSTTKQPHLYKIPPNMFS